MYAHIWTLASEAVKTKCSSCTRRATGVQDDVGILDLCNVHSMRRENAGITLSSSLLLLLSLVNSPVPNAACVRYISLEVHYHAVVDSTNFDTIDRVHPIKSRKTSRLTLSSKFHGSNGQQQLIHVQQSDHTIW